MLNKRNLKLIRILYDFVVSPNIYKTIFLLVSSNLLVCWQSNNFCHEKSVYVICLNLKSVYKGLKSKSLFRSFFGSRVTVLCYSSLYIRKISNVCYKSVLRSLKQENTTVSLQHRINCVKFQIFSARRSISLLTSQNIVTTEYKIVTGWKPLAGAEHWNEN